ncbi:MAG TPA: hypothetical protein VJ770_15470 [Stellaceae bacterium]|nr:hypothetical protein [Stellaceae bacterium]
MILVDTNVLLDLVTDDPVWAEWSQRQLDSAAAQDELAINDIIYAKLSIGYSPSRQSPAPPCFSPARHSRGIAPPAERGLGYCPTSSSALMP